jgi:hypothetical protein
VAVAWRVAVAVEVTVGSRGSRVAVGCRKQAYHTHHPYNTTYSTQHTTQLTHSSNIPPNIPPHILYPHVPYPISHINRRLPTASSLAVRPLTDSPHPVHVVLAGMERELNLSLWILIRTET